MICAAVPSDAEAICAIWNLEIRTSTATFTTVAKSQSDLERLLAAQPMLAARNDEGLVVGFATYGPFRSGPGYAGVVEHSVYVARNAARHGFGVALLTALIDRARNDAVRIMVAGICAENRPALALHEKLGFQKTAHMQGVGRKFGRDLDLVLMQKNLVAVD